MKNKSKTTIFTEKNQDMKCIKCNTGELKPITIEQIEVDECNNCSGIWFDAGELEKILEKKNIAVLKNKIDNNTGHDELKSACPKCGDISYLIRIASLTNPSVHIDTCLKCYGQWLDGGEIEKLNKDDMDFSKRLKKYLDLI